MVSDISPSVEARKEERPYFNVDALAGGCAPGAVALRDPLLLGQSPGEAMAELGDGGSVHCYAHTPGHGAIGDCVGPSLGVLL